MNQEEVDQAVKRFSDTIHITHTLAAMENTDEGLWETFATRYLEASGCIVGAGRECRALPSSFIAKVVEAMHIRPGRKAEAAKRSDMHSKYEAATEEAAAPTTQEQPLRKSSIRRLRPKTSCSTSPRTCQILPGPCSLSIIHIRIPFLLFHVGQQKKGLLVVVAGGIARGRASTRGS